MKSKSKEPKTTDPFTVLVGKLKTKATEKLRAFDAKNPNSSRARRFKEVYSCLDKLAERTLQLETLPSLERHYKETAQALKDSGLEVGILQRTAIKAFYTRKRDLHTHTTYDRQVELGLARPLTSEEMEKRSSRIEQLEEAIQRASCEALDGAYTEIQATVLAHKKAINHAIEVAKQKNWGMTLTFLKEDSEAFAKYCTPS